MFPARPVMTRVGKGRRKCYPPRKTFSYINTRNGDPSEKALKISLPHPVLGRDRGYVDGDLFVVECFHLSNPLTV